MRTKNAGSTNGLFTMRCMIMMEIARVRGIVHRNQVSAEKSFCRVARS